MTVLLIGYLSEQHPSNLVLQKLTKALVTACNYVVSGRIGSDSSTRFTGSRCPAVAIGLDAKRYVLSVSVSVSVNGAAEIACPFSSGYPAVAIGLHAKQDTYLQLLVQEAKYCSIG